MSVKIGHASISEKGTINGAKGDSTGGEVTTRTWYNKSWNVLLRPKTSALAEASAKACEAGCANNNIGYGQNDRNTAYTSYKSVKSMSKIAKSNTDCSAFMTLCAIAGGCSALNYTSNAPTTSTMRKAFQSTGMYEVITDSKYLTSDEYLKRGDILVNEGHHTVMVLSNGSKASTSTTSNNTSKSSAYVGTYTVNASSLRMRTGAGTNNDIITSLPKGTKATCDGTYGTASDKTTWLYVSATVNGKKYSGYCSKKYLAK